MNNPLKYWRTVRYFIQQKYAISIKELELIIFLYDEGFFSRVGITRSLPIHKANWQTVLSLKEQGFVAVINEKPLLYGVTPRAKEIVAEAYAYLHNEKPIPVREIYISDPGAPDYAKRILDYLNHFNATRLQRTRPAPRPRGRPRRQQ
jgi:hypothetical protein